MPDTALETFETRRLLTPQGVTIAYDRIGTGPPLVLVHGSFTDHRSNWQFVAPELARHFTLRAVARRGRGESAATTGHSMEDEAADVAALIDTIDGPVHLLGHSYGAQVALAAASRAPGRIAKLVLYEPPLPSILSPAILSTLDDRAAARDWEGFTATFMRQVVSMTDAELDGFLASPLWPQFVADAPATQREFPALAGYDFDPGRFAALAMPVMLQVGTETQGAHWATDALAAVLPDVRIAKLPGQGHDAMFTAPDLYARQVIDFLRE
jgi:pimeloyl-ACP methyl ester carboxylesterase